MDFTTLVKPHRAEVDSADADRHDACERQGSLRSVPCRVYRFCFSSRFDDDGNGQIDYYEPLATEFDA